MARQSPDIPQDMQKVYRRFERWRSAHAGRLPIPVRLWSAAVELAREHGVSPTAQALRLEYGKLKRLLESADPASKRLARRPGPREVRGPVRRYNKHGTRAGKALAAGRRRTRSSAPPDFLELMTSPAVGLAECLIELEGRRGKMRIQWKGTTAPDLGGLSRALWESK
jgi:hypothetical protein